MEQLLSNLIITKVCSVTSVYTEAGATSKRNGRERWGIVLKYEGETVYRCNGKPIVSNRYHPILLPKGSVYQWECTQSGHYICMELESPLTKAELISCTVSNPEELLKIFKRAEYRRLQKKPFYETESIRDAYTVLLKLAEDTVREYVPEQKGAKLAPAIDYMLTHYQEGLRNEELAAKCGLSCVYFRKLFRELYGSSPMEYAKSLRIKKAKEILRGDYGSIGDIAMMLGYASIYDFSRDFKRHVGVSPSRYAKEKL